jgi:hypothetical protein
MPIFCTNLVINFIYCGQELLLKKCYFASPSATSKEVFQIFEQKIAKAAADLEPML